MLLPSSVCKSLKKLVPAVHSGSCTCVLENVTRHLVTSFFVRSKYTFSSSCLYSTIYVTYRQHSEVVLRYNAEFCHAVSVC